MDEALLLARAIEDAGMGQRATAALLRSLNETFPRLKFCSVGSGAVRVGSFKVPAPIIPRK